MLATIGVASYNRPIKTKSQGKKVQLAWEMGAYRSLMPLGGDAPLLGRAGFLLGGHAAGQAGQVQGSHALLVARNVLCTLTLIC